eukprot:GFKZ01010847.1.p1 GENE.GFKZ01010847.1~~GFKZ01010847.1.p1  ORF type:complete len:355 (+),score=38.81 GFKZ01010847.1:165-1229(+)
MLKQPTFIPLAPFVQSSSWFSPGVNMPREPHRSQGVTKRSRGGSKFYGIRFGKDSFSGVVRSWPECSRIVSGVQGVKFKSFPTYSEALAFAGVPVSGGSSQTKAKSKKKNFYAVRNGLNGFSGVLNNWPECELYVRGAPGVRYKGFATLEEAQAFAANKELGPAGAANLDAAMAQKYPVATSSAGRSVEVQRSEKPALIVYTDGACTNNGKVGSAAGYGVFFGEGSPLNISARLNGKQTNQRAEMTAVLEAIRTVLANDLVKEGDLLEIHTDSMYTKNGLDEWIHGWQKKGWVTSQGTPVKNKDLWVEMYQAKTQLTSTGVFLRLKWVKGHVGNPGNEAADRLAVSGIYGPTAP